MSRQRDADRGFFILGYGRSGTTLFRRMLSAHPRLFVAPEADIFQRLPPHMPQTITSAKEVDAILAKAPPYYARVYDLEGAAVSAKQALPISRPAFFALLIRHARIAEGKADPLWGHKMPSEWPYIDLWRRWYPQARFIHIVRHPQDAISSMVQYQLQRYRTTAVVGAWQWQKSFAEIRRQAKLLGAERYRMVRYETLVADPEAVLGEACDFLGVDKSFVPGMIDYKSDPSAAHVDGGEHMQQTHGALTTSRVGRSAETFSVRQMAFIDHICRRCMKELEYGPRSDHRLSLLEKAGLETASLGMDVAWAGIRAKRRMGGQL